MSKTNLKTYTNPDVDTSEKVAQQLELCAAKVRAGELDYTMIMLVIHLRGQAPGADFLGNRPPILTTIGALETIKAELIALARGVE